MNFFFEQKTLELAIGKISSYSKSHNGVHLIIIIIHPLLLGCCIDILNLLVRVDFLKNFVKLVKNFFNF
jgi:hypothetical protein